MRYSANFLQDCMSAAAAVGYLDALVSRSPLYPAWATRAAFREGRRLAGAVGVWAPEDRTLAVWMNLDLGDQRDFGMARRTLEVIGDLLDLAREAPDAHVPSPAGTFPGLLDGLFREVMEPDEAGRTVARGLAAHGFTSRPLPSPTGIGGFSAVEDDGIITVVKDIERTARKEISEFLALRLRWRRWRERIGPKSRNSRLPLLVDLVAAVPWLTAAHVARHLGMTPRGAGKLLAELTEAGVVQQVDHGRRTWRVYTAEDLAPKVRPDADVPAVSGPVSASGLVPLDGVTIPTEPIAEDPTYGIDLTDLLRDVETASRRASDAIGRYNAPLGAPPED